MECHVALGDIQLVDEDAPRWVALGGVGGHRVGQCHVDDGTVERRGVHPQHVGLEVDAVALYVQPVETSLHPYGGNESIGIEFGISEREFIHLHLSFEKGFELYARHQFAHIGDGVAQVGYGVIGFDHLEILDAQVEREFQGHVSHADVHARFLRGIGHHLLCHPILYWRYIEQHKNQQKEQDGRQYDADNPFKHFFHKRKHV